MGLFACPNLNATYPFSRILFELRASPFQSVDPPADFVSVLPLSAGDPVVAVVLVRSTQSTGRTVGTCAIPDPQSSKRAKVNHDRRSRHLGCFDEGELVEKESSIKKGLERDLGVKGRDFPLRPPVRQTPFLKIVTLSVFH